MRNDRRFLYQQEQIKKLTGLVNELEQEKKSLIRENESLRKINDNYKTLIEEAKSRCETAEYNYIAARNDALHLCSQLSETMSEAKKMKTEYENKSKALLKRLEKQNN